ncbi:MAG: ROK family protein [Clostridiaceae bacterium]
MIFGAIEAGGTKFVLATGTKEENCPFHGTCLEGLASGPAIEGRTKLKGIEIPEDHESWMYVADYISQAIVNYILVLSPINIILGGGVMDRKFLYPLIRKNVKELLNGYIVTEELKDMDNYITAPSLAG